MISVIAGTNREKSRTEIIARYYQKRLKELSAENVQLLALSEVDQPLLSDNSYKPESQTPQVKEIQDKYFVSADRWIIVIPEYNGGLPGIFKSLIDAISIREYQKTFLDKKIALVGVSAGKAGNLRGLDYLANLFSYVKAKVFRNRLPLSQIESLLRDDELVDGPTKEAIDLQLKDFLAYK